MKTPHSHAGNVLLTTVALLAMVCAFAGIALNTTGHTAHNTVRSRDVVAAQAAAEGALEYAYAIWSKRIGRGQFASEAYQNLTPPAFPGVEYADDDPLTVLALDAYGVATTTGVPITGRVPGYVGWSGRTRNYAAIARVKLDGGTIIGVRRLFQYTEVPLFQSMFFFQHDLEFYRPATMVVNGLMHTNGTMYIRGDEKSLTIQGNVTHHVDYKEVESPWAKYWTDGYMKNWAGFPPIYEIKKEAQLNQVPAIQPMGGKPEEVFDTTDNDPNNDGYRELIEPRDPAFPDQEAIASRRLINKASLVIEIKGDSVSPTITVKGQGGVSPDATTVNNIRNSFSKVLGRASYEYTENKTKKTMPSSGIYDARESAWVDVTTFDIAKFKTAISGMSGFNNVVYVHDTTQRNSGDNVKTIRLLNGHSLPSGGLTIASENPVYIQGDYNTGLNPPSSGKNGNKNNNPAEAVATGYTRQPSAIIADAVMLLSNSWKDSNSDKALTGRVASNSTYNTAILAGFMPSTDPVGKTPGSYSGGANNFPRFLEQWQNVYCTYLGSMVELFESQMFRGRWNTGSIYGAPLRCWNFDSLFLTTPPPGSVEAVVLNRGPWSRF